MKSVRAFPAVMVALLTAVLVSQQHGVSRAQVSTSGPGARNDDVLTPELLQAFSYRNVGPFRMQARASAIAVPNSPAASHPYTFYVATWTGGVFKTTNGGVTFTPMFDRQNKLTIGALVVAPSNPRIVWVGTGETAVRAARTQATASTSPWTPARRGQTWGCATPITSLASSFTHRIPTSSTWA
jgi:hypothetical protein